MRFVLSGGVVYDAEALQTEIGDFSGECLDVFFVVGGGAVKGEGFLIFVDFKGADGFFVCHNGVEEGTGFFFNALGGEPGHLFGDEFFFTFYGGERHHDADHAVFFFFLVVGRLGGAVGGEGCGREEGGACGDGQDFLEGCFHCVAPCEFRCLSFLGVR